MTIRPTASSSGVAAGLRVESVCRSCGSNSLEVVLALGEVPLANALPTAADTAPAERRFPLTLAFCPDCSLVQILETVDPKVLFSDYLYASSFSTTMLAHAAAAAGDYRQRYHLNGDSLVVEVASNDGYLLRNMVAAGVPVLGIEPAANIARVAEAAGVPTMGEFFGLDLARRLVGEGRRADLIIANNVLAHVADLNGVVAGMATLLAPGGRVVVEVPYVSEMIRQTEFDTIYHEHLCYFSVHALSRLFDRHGLKVTRLEMLPVHGGSLRLEAAAGPATTEGAAAVEASLADERQRGLTGAAFYRGFAASVEELRRHLLAELQRRRAAGQMLAAYGASAKGSTLMNFCGIDDSTLSFVVDRSTLKQGRLTPGNHLPILAPEALMKRRPHAVLLLTWNFATEIFRQQSGYLASGGEFIIPIPRVRSVGKEVLT